MTQTKLSLQHLVEPIYEDMQRLTRFLPIDKLEELLRPPVTQMEERVAVLLPCTRLAADGVSLSTLILLTENYICEVRINPQRPEHDFIDRRSILNIRVVSWSQEIKEGEVLKAVYYLAEVHWLHAAPGFGTELNFAGSSAEERDAWIAKVFAAVPTSSILRR